MAYEQKPLTFSLFKDDSDRVSQREDFYKQKGWDGPVPTYSGRFILEDGAELQIEAKVIDGKKGKFFSGRAWRKKDGAAPAVNTAPARNDVPLDDDIPF
jgi:hypothetical protein